MGGRVRARGHCAGPLLPPRPAPRNGPPGAAQGRITVRMRPRSPALRAADCWAVGAERARVASAATWPGGRWAPRNSPGNFRCPCLCFFSLLPFTPGKRSPKYSRRTRSLFFLLHWTLLTRRTGTIFVRIIKKTKKFKPWHSHPTRPEVSHVGATIGLNTHKS